MANKSVFSSATRGKTPAPATAVNEAGGRAFAYEPRHALAQFAATGTINDTFYTSAMDQIDTVLELCKTLDPTFVGKVAVYARTKGFMKDMPALLCAALAARPDGVPILKKVFPTVIDNGKMLRNFVQIVRSGKTGRKSLGTAPKKLAQAWFASRSDDDIFRQSIGNDPSMKDVIKLVRPKPTNDPRRALLGYLIQAKEVALDQLPGLVRHFEAFKSARALKTGTIELPNVPMEMLTGLELTADDWKWIAARASWTQTRMNLNTFARHGVLKDRAQVGAIAARLRDPNLIAKARVFPYQLLAAYKNTGDEVPVEIRNALQDAMEIAIVNTPIVDGQIVICPDVSGSMQSPVTGLRKGSTSSVRCIDIAGLIASVFMRKNETTRVLPFEHGVTKLTLNPRDSVMTNAEKLARIGGGGTNCAAPLALLNAEKAKVDLVIFVSDNESWMDTSPTFNSRGYGYGGGYGRSTGMQTEWNALKVRNPKAKLVCIDIQANRTGQAQNDKDVLNIGGFSDSVFDQIRRFASGDSTQWADVIDQISLE